MKHDMQSLLYEQGAVMLALQRGEPKAVEKAFVWLLKVSAAYMPTVDLFSGDIDSVLLSRASTLSCEINLLVSDAEKLL